MRLLQLQQAVVMLTAPTPLIESLTAALAPYVAESRAALAIDAEIVLVADLPVRAVAETPGWPTTRGVSVGIDAESRKVWIQADVTDREHRLAVLQYVRGILVDLAAHRQWPVHGGVVKLDGRGVLLAGAKGAGKTSFTTALLRTSNRGRLITNDKGLARGRSVHGLPFAVLVGEDGARQTPELAHLHPRQVGLKLAYWPQEFAAAFDCEVGRSAAVAVGIWCDADFDRSDLDLEPLDTLRCGSAARAALAEFSTAMLPRHLTNRLVDMSALHRYPQPWTKLLKMPWLRASGNPWSWGPDHERKLMSHLEGE